MRYRSAAAALGLIAVTGGLAHAEEPIPVTAVTETADAIYFAPADPALADVVFFFPKLEVDFGLYRPDVSSAYAATLEMKEVTQLEPGQLRPEWAMKSIHPYILRPTTECTLEREPEMRFVNQLVRARGRDVSYPQRPTPVCQFTFRLPDDVSQQLLDELEARASAGGLIERELELVLEQRSELPWSALYDVLAADPALGGGESVSRDEAVFLIVVAATVQDQVSVDLSGLSPEMREALVLEGLEALFVAETGDFTLRDESPTSGFTIGVTEHRHAL